MAKKIKQNKEKKEIPKKDQNKTKKEINKKSKSKENEKENPKNETIKDIEQEDEQNEIKDKEFNKEELNKKYELKLEQVSKDLIPKISTAQIEKALKALISYKNKQTQFIFNN